MQLKPHSTLQNGKYEIIHSLGQGGFGITYLAEQTLMDRAVCIKEFFIKEYCERDDSTSRVSLGTASNAAMMERYMNKFIKEAKTIARLDHPNIVRIYDVFKENNTAYIVMEYLDGMSLGENINLHGPLSEKKAVAYIKKVGEAISFAHSQHIMHLDVKPSNIMLDKEHDRPVLIDFGLAKQYTEGGEQTSSTPVGLSQGYAPLEQYQSGGVKDFSPATDIYSLGATLFKLLTGKTPPSASEVNEDGLPSLSETLSASVRHAIEKAMQPRRKDRPQSIDAFLELLDAHNSKEREEHNDETDVTVIKKPISESSASGATSSSPDGKQSNPTSNSKISTVPAREEVKNPAVKTVLKAGAAILLVLSLFLIITRRETSPDSISINGMNACSINLSDTAAEKKFKIEKNFKERWTYSGVPDWCTVTPSEGKIILNVTANKTKESRFAKIQFKKKDGNVVLAELAINQKAGASIPIKAAKKAVGAIRFSSTPSGAEIWIDGKNTKKTTPEIIDGISVGKHDVKLVLEGYNGYSGKVTVSGSKRMVLDRTLSAKETAETHQKNDPIRRTSPKSETTSSQPITYSKQEMIAIEDENVEEEPLPFVLVEEKPKFMGGDVNKFSKWVNSKLVYPEIAKENGVQGRVTLQFTVDVDGSVRNVVVLRGVDPSLDKEAVRIVSSSPKWTPGKQRDRAVKVTYTFPVIFQLR